jgi:hypothetical protein
MSRLPSAAGTSLVPLLLVGLLPCAVYAETTLTVTTPAAAAAEAELYLEVYVNGTATGLIGAFRLRADGTLAIAPRELEEIGFKSAPVPVAADGASWSSIGCPPSLMNTIQRPRSYT